MMLLGVVDYVVIGLMLAISASVGIFFRFTGGRQKTTNEFLMAGKNMSIWPVAFSLMATYMSAISVLGIPAETYMYGSQFVMWMIGLPVGGLIAGYVFLPVFYDLEVSTVYEYLEKRFGKLTRTVASLLFTVQMILYMAVVLYAPSLALNAVTGLSTWASVVTLAVVCTFYCSLGGLKAVLWTDVFQATLMYVTIAAVVFKGSMDVGGIAEAIDIAAERGRVVLLNTSTDFTERYTLMNVIFSGLMFSTHSFGANQAQIQRMLSVGNLKRAQIALILSMPMIFVFNVFCSWDGLVIYSNFYSCDPLLRNSISSPDQLMPLAIMKMFSSVPGLAGLCIAGVFSASLSTISSAMNSLTAVTMEDFIRPFCFCKRLTESWAAFLAKIIAIAYGGFCLLLTFVVANFRGVIEASNIMFGMVGAPVLGIFMLGMLTKTANEKGTLIGLLVGFTLNAWMGFGSYAAKPNIPILPQTTEGCPVDLNFTATPYTLLSNMSLASSISLEGTTQSSTASDDDYIFPMYKISFLWYPYCGFLTVVVVGYVASFIIGLFEDQEDHKPEIYSPLVRKWFFGSTTKTNGIMPKEIEMGRCAPANGFQKNIKHTL